MGVFVEFKPKVPIFCPICGYKVNGVQTRELKQTCGHYYVGDDITSLLQDGRYKKNLIIEEEFYCCNPHSLTEHKEYEENISSNIFFIYITIKDGIYKGVSFYRSHAEDLGDFYDESDYQFCRY